MGLAEGAQRVGNGVHLPVLALTSAQDKVILIVRYARRRQRVCSDDVLSVTSHRPDTQRIGSRSIGVAVAKSVELSHSLSTATGWMVSCVGATGDRVPVEGPDDGKASARGRSRREPRQLAAELEAPRAEHRQAGVLRRQLTEVLEGTADLVDIVDTHSRGLYLNSAGLKELGIGGDEGISCPLLADSLSGPLRKLFQREVSRTTAHGATRNADSLIVSRNGQGIPV